FALSSIETSVAALSKSRYRGRGLQVVLPAVPDGGRVLQQDPRSTRRNDAIPPAGPPTPVTEPLPHAGSPETRRGDRGAETVFPSSTALVPGVVRCRRSCRSDFPRASTSRATPVAASRSGT